MRLTRLLLALAVMAVMTVNAHAGGRKVYLVNGLFSKALGYGLTNLAAKIPDARHFKFAGGVSQAAINGIIADATKAYNADPTVRISLVGISQGANAVTQIAAALNRNGVKVYYLGVIEGGSLTPVPDNVAKADNFICSGGGCARKPLPLAAGNTTTRLATIEVDTGHVDSSNHPRTQNRILSQIN